ncbi:MAG: tetratricopeptide repeat protein [Hyphomonadaceae bacterium]|nr:tetratricopeptide repeat protein [Hyphomonadaceae bacterium]
MYATLGDMERARSDYENAYRFFTLALDSQRRDPDTYNNRATVLLRLGRYDEAISDIDRAISLSDSSADVVMGSRARPNSANRRSGQLANLQTRRGFANALRGDWVSAITAYDDAARFAPDDPLHEADQCAGRAAARIELEAARAYCEHALRVGTNFTTLFAQAFLDFVEGDLPRARAGFEAAALTYPDSPFAEYALGVVDAHMGLAEGYTRAAAAESKIDPFDLLFYKNAGLRLP